MPQLIYSETVIRLSRLLSAVRIRDGSLDETALRHVVMNEPLLPLCQPERPVGSLLLRKTDIANFLFRALPLAPTSDLPVTDAVPILVGVVSVLTVLGLQRKKAFVLRELLAIMVPGLVQARKIGAAEVGIHPAAGLSTLSDATFDINALDIGPGNMEEGIRALLTMIGETYGVPPSAYCESRRSRRLSTASNTDYNADFDSITAIVDRSFRCLTLNAYGDLALKIDSLKTAINLCEALPDFEGVLDFTVELLQTIRGDLMLPEDSRIPPCLPDDEQIRLLSSIKRTVGVAHKLGTSDLEAEYWDDFLVRGVELLGVPDFKKPFHRSKKELNAATASSDAPKTDPFLYNPFSKRSSKASELLLIVGEHASFKITFQNLYEFEIEIESLRLDSNGVPFDAELKKIWLPPFSFQEVIISGVAHSEGILNITGCIVKIRHCRKRNFPIFTKLWKPNPQKRIKRTGLAAKDPPAERPLSWSSTASPNGNPATKVGPETDTCSVKVIKQQPSVVMQSISLSQSAMMILEGENRVFGITLQNVSTCPVDFILFTFQDSTTRQLQSALSKKDLLPAEAYELELQLLTKPSLHWRRSDEDAKNHSIAPGKSTTFTIEVFGKPGLQDATMQIDYCYLGTPGDIVPDTFYTRQLSIPITITVNASVEVARCDIVPLTGDFAWSNMSRNSQDLSASGIDDKSLRLTLSQETLPQQLPAKGEAQLTSMLSRLGIEPYGSEHCLVILDLRNIWPNTLSVNLQVSEDSRIVIAKEVMGQVSSGSAVFSGDLQPGQASRFILILPRIFLDKPHTPIPILNTGFRRQFVVSANKLSFEAEAASREAFWYREELLKCISGQWKEDSSGREGKIEFRNIRLNQRMVDALRIDEIEVTFQLSRLRIESKKHSKSEAVIQIGRSKYITKTNDFLTLTVGIQNHSSESIHPLLRLQPSLRNQPSTIALDLSRRLVWTGMLQQVLPILKGGEIAFVTLGVTALCRGEYEFGASVEEVRTTRPSLQDFGVWDGNELDNPEQTLPNPLSNDGSIEDTFGLGIIKARRIWHSRENCIILARDQLQ